MALLTDDKNFSAGRNSGFNKKILQHTLQLVKTNLVELYKKGEDTH